jgi:hypothetical protein
LETHAQPSKLLTMDIAHIIGMPNSKGFEASPALDVAKSPSISLEATLKYFLLGGSFLMGPNGQQKIVVVALHLLICRAYC